MEVICLSFRATDQINWTLCYSFANQPTSNPLCVKLIVDYGGFRKADSSLDINASLPYLG
jgi:hypothetical protein